MIPLVPGTTTSYDFQLTLQAVWGPAIPGTGEPASGTVSGDFSHTGIFGPATVQDLNGNTLDGVSVSSETGYDYLTGTVVPLPPVGLLFTSALTALGLARKEPSQ